MKKIKQILILFTIFWGYFNSLQAFGAELHVSTADELQSALTTMQASSNDAMIYLAAGTYQGIFIYESTSIGASKSLTIKAEDGLDAGQVILDGNDQGRTITISAATQSLDVLMERLTIRRGYVSEHGGGLYINTQGDVKLEGLKVLDNTGSGIYAEGPAEFMLSNSSFLNNSGSNTHGGCGLHASDITSMKLEKNIFSSNSTNGRYYQYGGAVHISKVNSVTLDKNTFLNNHAADVGGALYIDTNENNSVLLIHNVFSNNDTEDWGGGIFIGYRYGHAETITITNNLIVKNYAKNGAGGIYLQDKSAVLEIVNNTILRNYNDGTSGGGISIPVTGARLLRIYNNIIQNNENSSGNQDLYTNTEIEKLYNNNIGVVEGESGYEGSNINVDSSFVSRDDDDYHLNSDSPCIDTGSNEAYEIANTDLEGTNRIINDFIDIGAYEYVGTGDNPVCSADHPELCQCEYDCELVGNAWWKSACYNMDAQYQAGYADGQNDCSTGGEDEPFIGELADTIQSYLILTESSTPFYIPPGSYVQTYGSSANDTINVKTYARVELQNVIGANLINIEEASSKFTISSSGTRVSLSSSDGTLILIPATLTKQRIRFADGSSQLFINIDGSIMLGNQVVNEIPTSVTLPGNSDDTSSIIF